MKKELIYLDHAAATPLDKNVLKAMMPYFSDTFFNPSSPYQPAIAVRRAYNDAKHKIAEIIGVQPAEIVITAGATESINLAFNHVKGHVVTTAVEHPAVIEAASHHDATFVSVDTNGRVDLEALQAAITPQTELMSIGLANSEIGTIQPLRDIAEIVKKERLHRQENGNKTPIYFHSDASQGVGQLDVQVTRLGVDMLTLNAGKMYGPKQVGLLYASRQIHLVPTIVGGGQENGKRSGTENVAGTIGFAEALEQVSRHRKTEVQRLTKLRDEIERTICNEFSDTIVSGHPKHRLAGHTHISFPGVDAERLVFLLEAENILVATGSACAANKGTRSHVLEAIGLEPEIADGSLRITLGKLSTDENCQTAAIAIIEAVKKEKARQL